MYAFHTPHFNHCARPHAHTSVSRRDGTTLSMPADCQRLYSQDQKTVKDNKAHRERGTKHENEHSHEQTQNEVCNEETTCNPAS
ncbi:hypothetical protein Y032_0046g1316 [Ancylostoma ceylanicum]|uniref:Uncharacterized protein n=1 Tax=Ancylostoma ceylanicum TaxID=53326 RepID=A0A016UDE3_9BILA|nr:hypothetical protein Y032_0046g1316 [Ancylostoma ceylanicum]